MKLTPTVLVFLAIVGVSTLCAQTTATPVITLATGTYLMPTSTTITDATSGAVVQYCYKTSGDCSPDLSYTASSSIYVDPSATETICASAIATGYGASTIVCNTYTNGGTQPTAAPVITLASGAYAMPTSTTITDSTSGAAIVDCIISSGTCTPTTAYTAASSITISSAETICAGATATNYSASTVTCDTYTNSGEPAAATPVITLASGTYAFTSSTTTTITDSTSGASIFWCYKASGNCSPGTAYTSAITVDPSATETICANATATGYGTSLTVCNNYINSEGGEAQTITFTAPPTPVTYGVSPITLSATASSGLAVTFSVTSGPASVSGDTLTITGVGTVVVAANQAGNATYAAAPAISQTIVVNAASSQPVVVYSYTIPSYVSGSTPTGYDANGNVVIYSDLLQNPNGTSTADTWDLTYNTLNELTAGTGYQATPAGQTSASYCWSYDAFGNRTLNYAGVCTAGLPLISYSTNNQMNNGLYGYDASGNVKTDSTTGNTYVYDPEGRVCAVSQTVAGTTTMTGYVYNANGVRVSKGAITSMSCNPAANGLQPAAESDYVLGLSGEQVTEMASGGSTWVHTNVFAAGKLIATYNPQGLYFYANDWLGNRRVTTTYTGAPDETCTNLPFGDGLNCTASIGFPTEHHFTGKERDSESGNDYFGARYYASSMGRFLSPDPSGLTYADITNPQSFNLYSYAWNNPLRNMDPTGMYCFYGGQGDTVENDSDPTDYDFGATSASDCGDGGQWIDNPSSTVTVSAGDDNGNDLSLFPTDTGVTYQFIPGASCSAALQVAGKTPQGVARADANSSVLSGAASANNISPKLLAAVGVRETDFRNVQEVLKGGKPGPGMGVFQLTNQPGVSPAQAFNVTFAANKAANMLSSNMSDLSNAFSFTPAQLLQATAASYNLGVGGISGNPSTIDNGSANGNYGSNVVNLMACF